MNEQQARDRGYEFEGMYTRRHEEVLKAQADMKKQGFRSVIVTVPDNPLSRGGGGRGWSLYVEERYILLKRQKDLTERISQMPARRKLAFDEYQQVLADLDKTEANLSERLSEVNRQLDAELLSRV